MKGERWGKRFVASIDNTFCYMRENLENNGKISIFTTLFLQGVSSKQLECFEVHSTFSFLI